MSSDEYVSRMSNADPELTPLERVVKRHANSSYMFALKHTHFNDEQKFAVVLEQLVQNQKGHLAMMQLCIIAARAFKESKQMALQDWCEAYLEHHDLSALRLTAEDE